MVMVTMIWTLQGMLFVNEVGLYEVRSSQLERKAKAKRQKGKKGSNESAGEEEEVEGGMPDEDTGDEEGQLSWWCGVWGAPSCL